MLADNTKENILLTPQNVLEDNVPLAPIINMTSLTPLKRYDEDAEGEYGDANITENIIQTKLSQKIRSLNTFLTKNFITGKSAPETNIIDVLRGKTYCIPNANIEEFFTIFEECRLEGRSLHFAERQEHATLTHSGVMIDLDRFQHSRKTQFTTYHFKRFAQIFAQILEEVCDLSSIRKVGFHTFFIQKPEPVLEAAKSAADIPVYKDGIHMVIPDVWLTKGVKKYIINEMINRDSMSIIFNDIDHIESATKMLDKMSSSVPVNFYGASKPGKPAYKLLYGMYYNVEGITPNLDTIDSSALINPNYNYAYELSLGFYCETFNDKPTWLKKQRYDCKSYLEAKIRIDTEKTEGNIIAGEDIYEVENTVDILAINNPEANYLKKLLGIIDLSYAIEYEKWFKVICAIAHTSSSFVALAQWFSQRAPKLWTKDAVERVWNEALSKQNHESPVTKRSIIHWAKTSEPEKFAEIDTENYVQILSRFVYTYEGQIANGMIAKVLHAMLREKFVVALLPDGRFAWFEMVTPGQAMKKGEIYKWRLEHNPINLHLYIADHLPKIYFEQLQRIKDRKDSADGENLVKYWSKVEKTFKASETKLYDDQFQNKIITQAIYRFYDRTFYDQLDKYDDILGVGNGILKLGIEPKLITGFHEYKISKFTDVDYIPYNPNNEYIKTLERVFHDIWIEEDVYEFILMHASTSLDHCESAFMLLMINSNGGTGKSSFFKMVAETLTETFVIPGKAGLLVNSFEKSNEANSAQMHMKDKTYVIVDEFEKNAVLNTTRIKTTVGGTRQTGRDLHEKQGTFKSKCNIVALNNHGFSIDSSDWGSLRRLKYYESKTKFVENPDPANPYEKLMDPDVEKKYPNDMNYKQAMLSILVHYRAKLQRLYGGNLGKVPCPTIKRETDEWINKQDTISRYISQMIVRSPSSEDMTLEKVCINYIEWLSKGNKKVNITMDETRLLFANSRLVKNITRVNETSSIVKGCRIRKSIDEGLELGESLY
jgi:phage/plasmid-associated DNA primase